LSKAEKLRTLPAIDELLRDADLTELHQRFPRVIVAGWVRSAVDRLRQEILDESRRDLTDLRSAIIAEVRQQSARELGTAIQPVINATGIILHTNLGRAPLAARAIERIASAAGYSNVELDLHSGKRNQRGDRVSRLLRRLTSAEDAIVVNNCAAATILVLQTLAAGGEVIVSRGQLVEIGGGFRLPDVFRSAGVELREVGTTNRTYLRDYESAINDRTAAIIRVHHSNFRMSGFVTEPTIEELVTLRRPDNVPVIDDLGSGWIGPSGSLSLHEPSVSESVRCGADLTLFSGDKLFGGPQCGIVVGRGDYVQRLRRSPMMRALRIDKLSLAAMEATLEIHLSGQAATQLPALAMLAASADEVHQRCLRAHAMLGLEAAVSIVPCQSQIGGGSVPGTDLPSFALRVQCDHPDQMARRLREGRPAIQPRIQHDSLLLDLRTVTDDQCGCLVDRLRDVLLHGEGGDRT
jgi:L-seryl-tRNA(Ser) seleniumtransferase